MADGLQGRCSWQKRADIGKGETRLKTKSLGAAVPWRVCLPCAKRGLTVGCDDKAFGVLAFMATDRGGFCCPMLCDIDPDIGREARAAHRVHLQKWY